MQVKYNTGNMLKRLIKKYTPLKKLYQKIDFYKQQSRKLEDELKKYKTWVPPGHFYSPIPDIKAIQGREGTIFNVPNAADVKLPIDLNQEAQIKLIHIFAEYYQDMPFQDEKTEDLRYYFNNMYYSYTDGIILYCMLKHLAPKRLIEVGSGFSSCLIMDTNERYLGNQLSALFIEPYPDRLFSLLNEKDKNTVNLIQDNLENLDKNIFLSLRENDILFIDSTHVSKIGSDVNYYLFEILPLLNKGVYIHIHDIFYPFEYPKEWVYEGRAWNEAYILRAFLQYNSHFEIVLFNNFIINHAHSFIASKMPVCLKNYGSSIWLKKIE